jgi:3-deoxy-7-phosphoheptulonate synthase
LSDVLQISALLGYAASIPVVRVGAIAAPHVRPGTADAAMLYRAYQSSATTMNQIRAHLSCGDLSLRKIHTRNREFATGSPARARHRTLVDEIDKALRFLEALGIATDAASPEFFTGHEALLLDFEVAHVRTDPGTGEPYSSSRHMVWIDDRTRHPDGPHVAFAAHIRNPVAVRLGLDTGPDDVSALIDRLDPSREPGRLTFVTALGSHRVRDLLPSLIQRAIDARAPVLWVCDTAATARPSNETRRMDAVLDEVTGFVEVHRDLGTHPGGINIEPTDGQALDLGFFLAELLRGVRSNRPP